MSSDPLLRFRPEFEILERCTYLVSHSLGAMPRGAREGLQRYAAEWNERGVRAWGDRWWNLPVTVGQKLGALVQAPADSVSMQPNVTLATAVFLSALEFSGTRRRLVTTELEFPSLLYLFQGLEERGAELVRVPSDDGLTIRRERLLEAIDERTALVALSQVCFRSSFVQDARAVARRAHEVGALALLDTYQSVGSIPVNLTELEVDAAVGGCLKWLCGGPGAAFLYVRPEVGASLAPRLTGWQSHVDPFAFETEPIVRADGAWRFLTGTPNIPSLQAAEAGLTLIAEAGIDAIRAKSLRQTRKIIEWARQRPFAVCTPDQDSVRGGTVSVDPPHSYEISRELLRRDVVIDYRPGAGIRMAPHFYTSDDEIDRALGEIDSIVADESWRRFQGPARDQVT